MCACAIKRRNGRGIQRLDDHVSNRSKYNEMCWLNNIPASQRIRSMAQQPSFPGYAGLRSRVDEVRLKAARDLQRYVSTELRELPAERYSSSLDDINQSIYSLISSQEVHEKKGGILAIGEYKRGGSGRDDWRRKVWVKFLRDCWAGTWIFLHTCLTHGINLLFFFTTERPAVGIKTVCEVIPPIMDQCGQAGLA